MATEKVDVLNNEFGVVKGITELNKKWSLYEVLIVKHRYWPKYVDSYWTKDHFWDNPTQLADELQLDIDKFSLHKFKMKEEEYIIMFIHINGTLPWVREERFQTVVPQKKKIQLNHPKVFHNHYQWQYVIDLNRKVDKNQYLRQKGWWNNRSFS